MRIDGKLRGKEVLKKVIVADAIEIRGRIEILVDHEAILERDDPTVAPGRISPRVSRVVGIGILVVGIVAPEFSAAHVLRTIVAVEIDAESRPAFGPVVESGQSVDFVGQRKAISKQGKCSPSRIVAGLDVPPRFAERRVEVREPKDRSLTHIKGRVAQDHAVVGVDAGALGAQLIVGLRAVARGQRQGLSVELLERRRAQTHRIEFVNLVAPLEIEGFDLPLLQIVDGSLAIEDLALVINPHVAGEQNLASLRIVFGVVAVNVRPAEVDLHIVFGNGHAALEARPSIRANLHRHV